MFRVLEIIVSRILGGEGEICIKWGGIHHGAKRNMPMGKKAHSYSGTFLPVVNLSWGFLQPSSRFNRCGAAHGGEREGSPVA